MRHEKQTAKLAHTLTGMPHAATLHMARSASIERHQPVPDALTAEQRALEARLTFALIQAFPDHDQPAGFPWGIAGVHADLTGLDIFPAPGTTEQVLAALVPYHDRLYGGVRGTAGVRVTITDDGWWILHDLESTASVRIAAPATADLSRSRPGAQPVTHRYITAARLTAAERSDLNHPRRLARSSPDGWLAHRDILGSRLLRRPGLINALADVHGNANIYSHASMDVVFEWCCGHTSDSIALACQKAGIMAGHAQQDLPGTLINRRSETSTTVQVGHAQLYLRHNKWICIDQHN